MNGRGGGIFDRFFNLCLGFFIAAGLLYFGVQLIASVLPWLLAIGGVLALLGLVWSVIRWRRERW